jgi:RimJ/RimL family protein N-acetyltransferase
VAHDTSCWEQLRLDTDRLCLRTPTPEDAEALYDLLADPAVMHGLGKEPVSALQEARAMIESGIGGWRTDGLGPFILETAAPDQQVVGQGGLMIFDTRGWTPSSRANAGSHAQPELGWALMRAHWGHGYATEAAAAIRDWAHESQSIDRLVSLISPDNVRSQRVAERLGAIPRETVTPVDSKRKTVVWRHPAAPDAEINRCSRSASVRNALSTAPRRANDRVSTAACPRLCGGCFAFHC